MTSEQTLLARGLLGSIVAISGYVALQFDAVWNLKQEQFDRYVVACMSALRLGLFFVIFGVLRIPPRGDVMNYYFPEALAWLHGRMPYRDFPSSYAPLHPFLDSLFVRVWHSEISLILFTILVEILMFYLAPRFLRKFLPENAVRTACILYLFSPISLQFVTIDGQDNVLIAFLILLSLMALSRSRMVLSGFAMGVSIAAIKFLPVLYPPLFLSGIQGWRNRLAWMAGGLMAVVPVYGVFAAKKLPLLYPLQFESHERTASCLIWLVEAVTGFHASDTLCNLITAAALAIVLLALCLAIGQSPGEVRTGTIFRALAVLTLTLMLFSKKSWPNYAVLVLLPLCSLFVHRRGRDRSIFWFQAFGVVSVLAHSLWAGIFGEEIAFWTHVRLMIGDHRIYWMLLLQIALLTGYVWLAVRAFHQLKYQRQPT